MTSNKLPDVPGCNPEKLISIDQVISATGLGLKSVYARLNPKNRLYDPFFPKQVKVGQRAARWVDSEVQTWVQHRISASRSLRS